MNDKKIVLVVVLFLCAICVTPINAQEIINRMEPSSLSDMTILPRGCFWLESSLSISWNSIDEPLEPGGAARIVNITLDYHAFSYYPLIGKILLFYCNVSHQNVSVALQLGEIPSYCNASLSDSMIQYPVTEEISSRTISLSVAVNEYAPAYGLCQIPIHVNVETLHGPFGLRPLVNGCNNTAILHVQPGYLPHIIVEPDSYFLNVTPGVISSMAINITNHGNARTTVLGNIIDMPGDGWNVLITDQVTLDVNMTGIAYLVVKPPIDFTGSDTITISFTPHKSDDYSQQGEPVNITITVLYEP
jgi:hypothetical protein